MEATLEAVKLRLRPIIMTSLAFVGGMVPLFIATGAGAASRIAVGTGVVGGMLAATGFGIFFIPVFYLSVRRWLSKRRPPAPGAERHSDQKPGHASGNGAPDGRPAGRLHSGPAAREACAANRGGIP